MRAVTVGRLGLQERIAEILRSEGADVVVADAADRPDPSGFDAYVIGSGVQIGSWHKGGDRVSRAEPGKARNPAGLAVQQWTATGLFEDDRGDRPLGARPGPRGGTGERGPQEDHGASAAIHPRDHRVFYGAYDPHDPPKSMQERLVRLMPGSKQILPAGDFREWDAIEAWAREIAAELVVKVPVACDAADGSTVAAATISFRPDGPPGTGSPAQVAAAHRPSNLLSAVSADGPSARTHRGERGDES